MTDAQPTAAQAISIVLERARTRGVLLNHQLAEKRASITKLQRDIDLIEQEMEQLERFFETYERFALEESR